MKDLPAIIDHLLTRNARCRRGETLLVAVSGGLDSMVLLHALAELAPARQWKLVAAHFNHRLRGRASGADAALVRRTARRLGLRCVVEAASVARLARRAGLSVEMAARQARHDFLARTARACGARQVVLAHHADDQVELFFLRLLHGAGASGLSGMAAVSPSPADRSVRLVRPLLGVARAELEQVAAARGVPYREDASNASLAPLRNRVRHQLLPLLRQWQPALPRVVLRMMEVLRAEDEFLAHATRAWRAQAAGGFDQLPLALQRRVLAEELLLLRVPPNYETIEFLRAHPQTPVMVGPRRVVLRRPDGRLEERLTEALADFLEAAAPVDLTQAGSVVMGGKTVRWAVRPPPRAAATRRRPGGVEWFDAAAVGPCALVRHWRPGDRYFPIGAPGEKKLQDIFVNEKVPAAERRRRLLAEAADGRIFWVEGLRIAEPFKLRPGTRQALRWEVAAG